MRSDAPDGQRSAAAPTAARRGVFCDLCRFEHVVKDGCHPDRLAAPYSRTHIGAIGDCINVAARLMSVANQSEMVVSNAFLQGLPEDVQSRFSDADPVEARNVGRIRAWKLGVPS